MNDDDDDADAIEQKWIFNNNNKELDNEVLLYRVSFVPATALASCHLKIELKKKLHWLFFFSFLSHFPIVSNAGTMLSYLSRLIPPAHVRLHSDIIAFHYIFISLSYRLIYANESKRFSVFVLMAHPQLELISIHAFSPNEHRKRWNRNNF